ncbi:hypothetical protein BH24ACT22_BH24ACT22_21230 [soil metagenome]
MQTFLEDSFSARARGVRANTFVIRKDDSVIGNMVFNGSRGADLEIGTLKALIRRNLDGGYVLLSGEDRVLTSKPGSASAASLDAPEIVFEDRVYVARISFLGNEAVAFSPEGEKVVLVEGNVTGRRYEVSLVPENAAALPAAILLLYLTATFRRKAYLT